MMQAIQTKFLPPTNTKGDRIKAICPQGSIVVAWDHRVNAEENHKQACADLVLSLGWQDRQGVWHCGQLADSSYVHVYDKNGGEMMKVSIEDAKNNFTPYRVVIEVESQVDQDALVQLCADPIAVADRVANALQLMPMSEAAVAHLLKAIQAIVRSK